LKSLLPPVPRAGPLAALDDDRVCVIRVRVEFR
jgi:hypothetical protein